MKLAVTLAISLMFPGLAQATDADGAFGSVVDRLSESSPCPISVLAVARDGPSGPVLAFTLKNTTARSLSFLKPSLPWTTADSISVAAITRSGDLIRGGFPIDDHFGTERITLAPGKTLVGDYDLSNRWEARSSPPSGFPPNSKVAIVWAWLFQPEGTDSSSKQVCSGVTVLATGPHGPNTSLERTREG